MKIKRLILSLFMFVWLATGLPVQAQETPSLAEVNVNFWPEFDQPSMLVIYHITLAPTVSLPAEFVLRIPAAAKPNAVATRQPDDSLLNASYTSRLEGDWLYLTIQASTPVLQVEYYDPGLTRDGARRRFVYQWPGDYAVAAFKIEVQQPIGASNMRFSPSLGPGEQAPNGLVYYHTDIGALNAGQALTFSLEYDKSDDALTASQVGIEPGGSLEQGSTSWQSLRNLLPWLLGLIGVSLIVGGGLWYWQSGRQAGRSNRQRTRHKPASAESEQADAGAAVYCHQCGKRAAPGDRYCRLCGTQLRLG